MDKILLWVKIAIASIPGGVLGIAFDDKIEEMLVGDSRAYVVAGALIVYGIFFIIIESMSFKGNTVSATEGVSPKITLKHIKNSDVDGDIITERI